MRLSKNDKQAFEGDDKWQSQKEVVPIGLGERGWQAYEPYKTSESDWGIDETLTVKDKNGKTLRIGDEIQPEHPNDPPAYLSSVEGPNSVTVQIGYRTHDGEMDKTYMDGIDPTKHLVKASLKKKAEGDDHSSTMAMYWDTVKDSFFENMSNWSNIRKELKKMYSEITEEDLEELFSQVQYYLNQYKQQTNAQKKKAEFDSTINKLVGPAQFISNFGDPLSGKEENTGEILTIPQYAVWGDIGRGKPEVAEVSDDIEYLQEKYGPNLPVTGPKTSEKESGDENYGFFDGPKDLGKNPSGDFPSVSWMPRGNEDMDVSPNASQAKKAKEEILPHDQESQIAAEYGPEMITALNHYNDAIQNGHAPDRALEYSIRELEKVDVAIDSSKLSEAVNTYLEVPK